MVDGFALRVDDDVDLVLREPWTNPAVFELICRNIARLREWEAWAQPEPDAQRHADFSARQLQEFAAGRALPTVIRFRGALVGTIGASIDLARRTASLGYWLDAAVEGQGLVTRSARAMIAELFARDVARIEIRLDPRNVRSSGVAERLGFTLEGTLRSAWPVGDARQDEAIYGLLA